MLCPELPQDSASKKTIATYNPMSLDQNHKPK
jgi:hypothetical protein